MPDYYAAVFGAGISGTAIANTLRKENKEILLVDPYVSEDAPGPPGGMVNPATGRRAKLSWRAQKCYNALRTQIDEISRYFNRNDLISDSGVVRPAITEKMADNFRRALGKYDWPRGWIRWMESEELSELNPQIAPNVGGLYVECGYTVYVDRYLNAYRKYLRKNGVNCRYDRAEYHFREADNVFDIHIADGPAVTAEHVIIAAGRHTPEFDEWSHIPLELVKGQLVRFEANSDLEWDHAVSARGYTMRRGKRELLVGSTYEHNFDNLETTREACKQIKDKLEFMLPGIANQVQMKDQLAGARVTTPNRLPVIGRHPGIENLCIYTGMNSKGLLFSHYVATLLANHLVRGEPILDELSSFRFNTGS